MQNDMIMWTIEPRRLKEGVGPDGMKIVQNSQSKREETPSECQRV